MLEACKFWKADKSIDTRTLKHHHIGPVTFRVKITKEITERTKELELPSMFKSLTGDNILMNPELFIPGITPFPENEIPKYDNINKYNMCLCGYLRCKKLYPVRHTPSNNVYAVGSSCIGRFNKDAERDIIAAQNNGVCKKCKVAIVKKGSEGRKRNYVKDSIYCMTCYDVTLFEQEAKRIAEQIKTYQLLIPLKEREEMRELGHNFSYKSSTQIIGYRGLNLPSVLSKYVCVPIKIPYNIKDKIKENFYVNWNNDMKTWETNKMSYNNIIKFMSQI